MADLIGGAFLVQHYGLSLALPLTVISEIGGRRATKVVDGRTIETFVEGMRPANTLKGHLTFHFKHEVPHLEMLARLFAAVHPGDLVAWFREEPMGGYVRRACFLYEWLTGGTLPIDGKTGGPYVDALDSDKVVAATAAGVVINKRWRVRDNMPGTPAFCPIVRKTPKARAAMEIDIPARLAELTAEFGEELLMKSAVWMTLRESKSSFAIEGEADKADRIQRFAAVLGRRTGQGELPLSNTALAEIQREILGPRISLHELGLRKSPVFVGESVHFQDTVHYIAPPPEDLQAMLEGLSVFLSRTQGQHPVMRSAVAAFGFIYIHPLADGNGRVHRFLINDILRRDSAVPDPMILPVSSLITSDRAERKAYDSVLEEVSRPLMFSIAGRYRFGASVKYPDGLDSNLHFDAPDLARPVWRMPDLTSHVIYLSDVVARTISEDMREESRYMRSHAQARDAIKGVIEMPDAHIDRVIRSIEANAGKLTHLLAKEIPALTEEGLWDLVVAAYKSAFAEGPASDVAERWRQRQ